MIICNTAVMIEDMKWNKKTADKRISNMRKIASELKIRIMQNETFFGENCDIKELAELVEKKMGTDSNLCDDIRYLWYVLQERTIRTAERISRINIDLQDLGTPLWKALQRPSQLRLCIVKILDSTGRDVLSYDGVKEFYLTRKAGGEMAEILKTGLDASARVSLLYDFYGQLLTEKKRQVIELYHEEDMSLSEIASELGITRAAVHDSLKSAERALENYEEKLSLVERFLKTEEAFGEITQKLDGLKRRYAGDSELAEAIEEIETIARRIEYGE